jgi:hypothetical protein
LKQLWSSKTQASKKVLGCSISVTEWSEARRARKDISVLPGYDVTTLCGVFAPRDTPAAIIAKLNATINESLKEEAVQKRLTTAGGSCAARPRRRSASTWRASLSAGTRCARPRAFRSSSSEPSAICQLSGQSGQHLRGGGTEILRCSGLLAAP